MKRSKNPLAGVGQVFAFTLKQICTGKGWLISTISIAALLAVGIPLLLWGIASASNPDKKDKDDGKAKIQTVLVCDETDGEIDYELLKNAGYTDITYTTCSSMEDAIDAIEDADSTVVLRVTKPEMSYLLTVYLPEHSALTRSCANSFVSFVQRNFSAVLMQKAELAPEQVMLLSLPVNTSAQELRPESGAEEEKGVVEELLEFLLPFFCMMAVYMMVILYGQSMANSVMLEKNSKLMETILTAVDPNALMAGKLFATAVSAVAQMMIWIFCCIGGCIGGVLFALKMVPKTESSAVLTMNTVIENRGMFSIHGILLALVILSLGFLLYLSLGAVAGAIASKAEDLSKTNVIYVLVLIVSFFCCLSPSSADQTQFLNPAAWLRYMPFTAMLVNPGELLLGTMGVGTALIAIAILILTVCAFVAAAAAIYKMLVLYRGQIVTPAVLWKMIRQKKK